MDCKYPAWHKVNQDKSLLANSFDLKKAYLATWFIWLYSHKQNFKWLHSPVADSWTRFPSQICLNETFNFYWIIILYILVELLPHRKMHVLCSVKLVTYNWMEEKAETGCRSHSSKHSFQNLDCLPILSTWYTRPSYILKGLLCICRISYLRTI